MVTDYLNEFQEELDLKEKQKKNKDKYYTIYYCFVFATQVFINRYLILKFIKSFLL